MIRATAASGVFTRIKPASASLDINEAVITDKNNIQLAAKVTVDINTCTSSQLFISEFSSSYHVSNFTRVFSSDTNDAADALTPDGPQIIPAGNLSAIEVIPRQEKLTTAPPDEAGIKVLSLYQKRHHRIIHKWYPLPGKKSIHAKCCSNTIGQKYPSIQSQRISSSSITNIKEELRMKY